MIEREKDKQTKWSYGKVNKLLSHMLKFPAKWIIVDLVIIDGDDDVKSKT